jgi:dTDP-4-amino-4,6-dideoxygalactose transaminase
MNNNPIRSKDRFLVFGAPAIEDAEIQEVVSTMKTGWLSTGPKVMTFQNGFKAYKDSEHAIAVNSCTVALHLSILAASVKPGD